VDWPSIDSLSVRLDTTLAAEAPYFQPALLLAAIEGRQAASQVSAPARLSALIEDRHDLRNGKIQKAKGDQLMAGSLKLALQRKEITLALSGEFKKPPARKKQVRSGQIRRLLAQARGDLRIVESACVKQLVHQRLAQFMCHGPLLAFCAIVRSDENGTPPPDLHLPSPRLLTGVEYDADSESSGNKNGIDWRAADSHLIEQALQSALNACIELPLAIQQISHGGPQ